MIFAVLISAFAFVESRRWRFQMNVWLLPAAVGGVRDACVALCKVCSGE